MPEAWGFLCPVHTPDGSPCGLLNHLSAMCRIVTRRADEDSLAAINTVSPLAALMFCSCIVESTIVESNTYGEQAR